MADRVKAFKHLVDRREAYRKAARRAQLLFWSSLLLLGLSIAGAVALVTLRIQTNEDVFGEAAVWVGFIGGGGSLFIIAHAADNLQDWLWRRDEIDSRIRKYDL